jgi:hypothetical protein
MNYQVNATSSVKTPPLFEMKNSHGDHWVLGRVAYSGRNASITNFIIEGYANDEQTGI